MISSENCLDLLIPFCDYVKREIRSVDETHAYYGTGEAGHWAVQSNFNVIGTLAVLGTYPGKITLDQEELRSLAGKLFRYNLHTHKTGSMTASCGNQWGGSWISVLGLERMVMGQIALEKFLTEEELVSFRNLRVYEADFLLHELEVVAGMTQMNKPESNYWNGSFLLRTAMDYPDEPHHDLWVEKGTKFLLNAISHPLDAASGKLYSGKPLRDWHAGSNFTPNFSLDHHGYMNVGYSIVTLSHGAYLYFYCKEKGYPFPEAAKLHLLDLWKVVKNFIYPDGRLLRIGGDTRARYCYCQAYLLPVLLLMEDLYADTDCAVFEKGLLSLFAHEQKDNPDGSFYGTRLENMKYQSRYYYTRLESDAGAVLGFGSAVCAGRSDPAPRKEGFVPSACQWGDELHCADLLRSERIVRSVVRRAGEGPVALAQRLDHSDLGEWSGNGFMRLTGRKVHALHEDGFRRSYPGAFINSGSSVHVEYDPWGEGEDSFRIARSRSAAAALPDGKTLIVLEYGIVVKEHYLRILSTINFQIPNDVYNGKKRCFKGENFCRELVRRSGEGVIDSRSRWINVDDLTTVVLGYGADSLKLFAPAEDLSVIRHKPGMTSLYFNSICADVSLEERRSRMPGEVLADTGCAFIAGITAEQSSEYKLVQLKTDGLLRAVEFTSPDGCWRFGANFGEKDLFWEGMTIPAGECRLIPEPVQ